MFGYFRFNQIYASQRTKRVYKNYYCGTCFALEYNFGEISRFILSYDAVILALTARLYKDPERELLPCFFKKNEKVQFFEEDGWKKLAAINVLLMEAKIDDDINDEKSPKAKAASVIFKNAIIKAETHYPHLAKIVRHGYKNMYELEKSDSDVIEICDAFSDMMAELMVSAYSIDEKKTTFIRAISRWLYFIDQLDDYDDDAKARKYNPLIIKNVSKMDMILRCHSKLFNYLRELFKDFEKIKETFNMDCVEDRLLYAVVNESVPNVTSLVMSNRGLPQLRHIKKEVEWEP